MSQFNVQSAKALCANLYCNKGKDGKRAEVAIRDAKKAAGYCSQPCASMARYKKRYKGTMSGRANVEYIRDKMTNL